MATNRKAPGGRQPAAAGDRKPTDYSKLRTLTSEEQLRYDDQVQALHEAIDKVKLAYHLYFIGTNPKPPVEERMKLDRFARQCQQNMPTRTMERFKMQSALIRYTHFCELWDKSIRRLEEGQKVPWAPISYVDTEEEAEAKKEEKAPEPPVRQESSPALARVANPQNDVDEVRKIYTSYMAARKKCGEEGEIPFEKFQAAITKQTETLRSKTGTAAVQYRVEIAEGKVSIKAKPVKEGE